SLAAPLLGGSPNRSPEHVLILGDPGQRLERDLPPSKAQPAGEEAEGLDEAAPDDEEVPDVPMSMERSEGDLHRAVLGRDPPGGAQGVGGIEAKRRGPDRLELIAQKKHVLARRAARPGA